MKCSSIVVQGFRATRRDETDLRDEAWSIALDQREFGPRQLLVAFADRHGRFRALAYVGRTEPRELGLEPCIAYLGHGAAAAVAFCDERVENGPPPPELGLRFALARSIATTCGVHLVDWFACDDDLIRSSRMALEPETPWWDVS